MAGEVGPIVQVRRRLVRLAGVSAVVAIVPMAALVVGALDLAPHLGGIAAAAVGSGVGGGVFAASLLSLSGLVACAAAIGIRQVSVSTIAPRMGRLIQSGLVPVLAVSAAVVPWVVAPISTDMTVPSADRFVLAGLLAALAFGALVMERTVAGIRPALLPEAPALRSLVLLPVIASSLVACVQAALGMGFAWVAWLGPLTVTVIGAVLSMIGVELALRALARWFLPAPPPTATRAAVFSVLAQVLAGSIEGGMAAPIKSGFGIDFSRSWSLHYLRAALLPAVILSALFCWGLSGLVMIGLGERGLYQRLGAPAGVLQPGLHLILPWPLGRTVRVEFGAVHEIAINADPDAVRLAERTNAEVQPPPSADRLWEQAHPSDLSYLIASQSAGRQEFQVVNADIRVLYRVGLSDAAALHAAISTVDPALLVRQIAGRRLTRSFAGRRLADLLGEQRETLAAELRAEIVADLAPFQSGLEILAVVVEAVHPPVGAAGAYHAVQAAAIGSRTGVAEARGQASAIAAETRQQVQAIANTARALRAEAVGAARTEQIRFDADRLANTAGGRSFLYERYLGNLETALARAPLTILDARLSGTAGPTIDLRPWGPATRDIGSPE